jgi:hypothetical protein
VAEKRRLLHTPPAFQEAGDAVQLFPEMLAQRRLANLKLSGYLGLWVMPKAEALSTRERWASVGSYSAVTLRFQSLNQGTRAR